ncbi:MAG: glycosyltransferase family 39 protein [Bdellovibrionales bacterium]|nr:glycosyltransferase family 39 protein [Bdellovibrionales bacterium]
MDSWLHRITALLAFTLTVLISGYLLFYNLNSPSIDSKDEYLHISATQSMLGGEHFLVPEVDGEAYLNKPPLEFWLSQLAVKSFGQTNLGFRFVSALSGLLLVATVYLFSLYLFSSVPAAVFSSLLTISSHALLMEHGFRRADLDGLLLLLQSVAMIVGYLAAASPERRVQFSLGALSGLLIGLSVLVKSVAGYSALIVLGLYLLTVRRGVRGADFWKLCCTIAAPALLIPALYLLSLLQLQPDALKTLWGFEIADRIAVGYHNNDDLLFYLRMLFSKAEFLPPAAAAIGLIYGAYCLVRKRSEPLIFLSIWTMVPLLVFSLMPSRLVWYVFPAIPALAILSGRALSLLLHSSARLTEDITVTRLGSLLAVLLCCGSLICSLSADAAAISMSGHMLLLNRVSDSVLNIDEPGIKIYLDPSIRWTKHERVYSRALEAEGTESDLGSVSDADLPAVMLLSPQTFLKFRGALKFDHYLVLPSMYERRHDVLVLARNIAPEDDLLRPNVRRYLTVDNGLRPLHGLGWPGPDKGHIVQKSTLGHATVLIEGDRLLHLSDVQVSLSVASAAEKKKSTQLDIYFNEAKVGSFEAGADYSTWAFNIAAGKFFPGDNSVTIAARTGAGAAQGARFAIEHVEVAPMFENAEPQLASALAQVN